MSRWVAGFALIVLNAYIFGVLLQRFHPAQMEEARIVSEIEALGGAVVVDGNSPGNPVIAIALLEHRINNHDVSQLEQFDELQILNVAGDYVTNDGLVHLSRLRNLRELSVHSPRLTDAGFVAIAEMPNLEWLCLAGNDIGDDAMRHVAKLSSLQALNIQETNVSDEGLRHLEGMPNLRRVALDGTRTTATGVTQLIRSCPGLMVHH